MKVYIIYVSIVLLEVIISYFILNSLYFYFILSLFMIINSVITFLLYNSPLITLLSMPSFFYVYSLFYKLDFYETLLLFSTYFIYYLATLIFIFIIFSLIKRSFYDYLIDEVTKTHIKFSPLKFVIGTLISIILYLFLYYNLIFLIGSLITTIIISLYGKYYELSLVTFSWISIPYVAFPKTDNIKQGIIVGKIIGKLGKSSLFNSAFNITNSHYRWVKQEGLYTVDFTSSKNYNVIILGTSGVGKSTLAKRILKQLNISFIVFDIHGEYNLENATKIDASKIYINPFSLFGRSPRERAFELSLMLKSLFNLGNVQTMDLANLIMEIYSEKGIDENDATTWNNPPPTFRDLLLLLERKKKASMSAQELSRYESLEPYIQFLTSSVFSNNKIEISDLFKGNYIIDFSKVATNEIKYIIIETLLKSIQSNMYIQGVSSLRKLIIIDEAPFILSKESGKMLLERLLSEGRKFGFGFILISQNSEYVKDLINNISYIFVFGLVEPRELDYASKLIGGSDSQIISAIYETLQKLPRGYCVTRDLLRGDIYLLNLTYGDQ